jgi:hypothetical protein
MSDHRALVEQYLGTEFPNASIMETPDRERFHGHCWSIQQGDRIMVLHVSQEFLTAQSEYEARAQLNNFNPAKALRGSAGRGVILSRNGVRYDPETPV